VEGLANGEELSDLQQSFIDHGAVQCGFCTPGMLMSADALLSENQNPDEKAIRKALAGNICRCTGYAKIVLAVAHAAEPNDHCSDCKS
jgi:carbon-monoxide dehydrogenase small subunit